MNAESAPKPSLWSLLCAACFAATVIIGRDGNSRTFVTTPKLRGTSRATSRTGVTTQQPLKGATVKGTGLEDVAERTENLAIFSTEEGGLPSSSGGPSKISVDRDGVSGATLTLELGRQNPPGVESVNSRSLHDLVPHRSARAASLDRAYLANDAAAPARDAGDEAHARDLDVSLPFALRWPDADPLVVDLQTLVPDKRRGLRRGRKAGPEREGHKRQRAAPPLYPLSAFV